MSVGRKYFIRPKNGEWQEITPADINYIDVSFGGQPVDQMHARMAQHCEISGQFEIEVRDYNQTGYNIIRKAEGTTAILADATK